MSNYNCVARTNYFKVNDVEAFKAEMKKYAIDDVWEKEGLIAIGGNDFDTGVFNLIDPEAQDDPPSADFVEIIAPHLADGQVCVMMEAGSEKSRYVVGNAIAFDNSKKTVQVNLTDIYKLAEKELGIMPPPAEY